MTIAGNVGKSRGGGARTMEITNAPLPGEDSVAEQTWHVWSKFAEGKARDSGLYYDSVESPSVDLSDPDQLRAGIIAARDRGLGRQPGRGEPGAGADRRTVGHAAHASV